MPNTPECGGCPKDEIAHAALIPVGSWNLLPNVLQDISGMVLLWTRCDNRVGYQTKIWNPNDPGGVAFEAPILEKINPPGQGLEDGPFCSGHVWVLDENKNPKLLTVGGQDRDDNNSATPEAFEDQEPTIAGVQNPCDGSGSLVCGLHKVYWFDPLVSNASDAWSDAPQDLTDGRWYPTVTTQLSSDGTQFITSVIGGSPLAYVFACLQGAQYKRWWTSDDLSGPWAGHTDSYGDLARSFQLSDYYWHYYPRPFQLTTGTLLTAGHAILCEDNDPPNPYAGPYGGNPVSKISPEQFRVAGPSPNADDTVLSAASPGGWNYCTGAILHTLHNFSYTETNPESHYDLNRVLVTGGSRELYDEGMPVPAQPCTHELVAGQWQLKASPATARVYANWVALPDGNLLLVGGSSHQFQSESELYYESVERFTPEGPTSPGHWTTLAPRPSIQPGVIDAPARGYHSTALLLQDGRVVVMGGVRPITPRWAKPENVPWSSVEIYRPGYCFESSRLRILSTQATDMHYGAPFFLTVNTPSRVHHACLIGVSSITHNFNYGQQYIELMSTDATGPDNLKLLAPPIGIRAAIPEGYYLLFVVEDRYGVYVPSKGVVVKLY